MKKKSKSKYLVIGILMFIICCNIMLTLGADASLNFGGEWYSKGFSSVSLWKAFVNTFTATLFKFRVSNEGGSIKLGLKDENGVEHTFDSYIKYDNQTGELSLQKDIPMFDGVKNISYKVTLNGEKDLRKILNVESYFGKTIGDIVKDVLSKKIKIGLIGERSNITLTANKNFSLDNPIIDVNYKKNINEDFTSPITEESDEGIVLNMTNLSISGLNNSGNRSVNSSNNNSVNNSGTGEVLDTDESNSSVDLGFKILNPKPLTDFTMFVNETKTLSIENSKENSIEWYLNGKLIKNNSQSYGFKPLKKGNYKISVKVKSESKIKEHNWNVEVKSMETPKNNNSFWIWIVFGFFFVIFWIGIIYYLKTQGKKNPQTTLS